VSPIRTVWLVARRELRERVASRAFQISTALTVLLVLGLLLAPTIFGFDDPPAYEIGVAGASDTDYAAAVTAGSANEDTTATTSDYQSESALRDAVRDGDVDIGIVDDATVLTSPDTDQELTSLVASAIIAEDLSRRADDLGLTADAVQQLLGAGPTIEDVEPATEEEQGASVVAFIGTVLLFVSIVTYGQWILIGVVEEKSSRVVEVVLGAVRPRHLLAGKVVGIGILGLAQLLIIAVMGLVVARATGTFEVPEVGIGLFAIVVLWFLLGFTFFASGFAVAGSLVSRQEDAQNASFPLTLIMLVGYFTATSALGGGDNPVLRTLSIIPPFSPMTMPLRQATGQAQAWEVVVAVVLMLVAIVAMLRIGGTVYSGGLLKTGGKIKVREALRAAEH
jgi:ABC-2 type transport system permease protein